LYTVYLNAIFLRNICPIVAIGKAHLHHSLVALYHWASFPQGPDARIYRYPINYRHNSAIEQLQKIVIGAGHDHESST
jgi:hypothetical protein